ncbi:MAG: C1 family peptidase [Armatimonadota bacterium]
MFALVAALLIQTSIGQAKLPSHSDLSERFTTLELPICRQNGPWCWAYTTIGVVEFELGSRQGHKTQLSPGYLTWAAQETDTQGSGGSNFGRANRGLEQFGVVPLETGGIPPSGGRIPAPTDVVINAGKNFDDLSFHWIRFWNRKEMPDTQLNAIKSDIVQGHPVAVGMQWPNHLSFAPNSRIMNVPERTDIFDGHCVILVGYTDDPAVPGGGSFLFRNSWGANWGDKGYASMPYELLRFCINDAYSVRIAPKSKSVDGPVQTLLAEDLKTSDISPESTIRTQLMSRYGNAWGDHKQLLFRAAAPNSGFSVEIPVAKAGDYEVRMVITRTERSGEFTVGFPDKKVSPVIDGAGPGVSRSRTISLGTHRFKAGNQVVRFNVTGSSSASTGMNLGLCEIQLVGKD